MIRKLIKNSYSPIKCKKCKAFPVTQYSCSGGWEHLECPKCGQKSRSYQNETGYINAINVWNHLNDVVGNG